VRTRLTWRDFAWPIAGAVLLFALAIVGNPAWEAMLRPLFPEEARLVYRESTLMTLLLQHLALVALSSVVSAVIGISAGVFVTRPAGADFFDVANDLANLAQTFPPIAVFALAVPLLGFGFAPTVLALTIYGILPILHNTIAGLENLPPDVLESARGLGLSPLQSLWRVELPLAAPVIMAGVRVSVVINVATATLGAVAGAGGLGAPIISGLVNDDPAVTLEGAVMAGLLALTADGALGILNRALDGRPSGELTA
jgi:osmoprotectant transport system permease protein